MPAGRPPKVDPGSLYAFAHQFYWDFRRLAEGTVRWRFDKKEYEQLTREIDEEQLIGDEDRERHRKLAENEIRIGQLQPERKEARLQDIAESETFVRRDWYFRVAGIQSRKQVRVPAEGDVIELLLNPNTTSEQIRELCKEAVMDRTITIRSETREVEVSAWPIPAGSSFPSYLSQYAEQYVAALRDARFPSCEISVRPTTRLKQFWFLSRALAGALYGVSTRTAINLVGSMRPEQVFRESRHARPTRRRGKARHIKFRH